MSKRIVVLVGSLAAALAGGWLMVAPFALGYRPAGAAWNHPTEVDFWTGVGVVAVGLVGIMVSVAALRSDLRARGALAPPLSRAERREASAAARAAKAEAASADKAARAALAPSGAGSSGAGSGASSADPAMTPADLRDLLAPLVQALLVDLDDHDKSSCAPESSGEEPDHLAPPASQTPRRSYT
ncbi:MAG: hypothetical protein ACRDWV_06615 [Acidimicrobiales bacterium]